MKLFSSSRLSSAVLVIAALAAAPALTGCGPTEYSVTGTDRANGTDGVISIEEIEGGNKMVQATLSFLPPPARVQDGMNTYVMWFYGNGDPQMAAVLEYDEEDRVGTATATSPLSRFEVVITAETGRTPSAPSEVVVARRRIGGS